MKRIIGVTLSSIAVVAQVVVLVWPFLAESFRDIMLYYSFTTINPLIGGVLSIGVLVVFAAIRGGRLSETTGAGLAIGLAAISSLVVSIWALTGPVDVFLARGWAFPAQRWILVGASLLMVVGVGLYAHDLGLFPSWK